MTVPDWVFSPWILAMALGLFSALRLPRLGGGGEAPLGWRDGILALLCGLIFSLVASELLSRVYLSRCEVTAPDLEEFCATVHGLRARAPGWVVRQPGAGLLPSGLSLLVGFMDGLALGAWMSSFLIGSFLYIGARLLLGPLAGVSATLLGLTFAPLAVLAGHMTFYPEATAGFLIAFVSGIYLLQRQTNRGLALAGVGVGLGLLVDFVGLLLTAPVVLIAIGIALKASGWRGRAIRVGIFALPILVSFCCARIYTPRTMSGFEEEIQFYIQDVGGSIPLLGPDLLLATGSRGLVEPVLAPIEEGDGFVFKLPKALRAALPPLHRNLSGESYIWGHTMPWELPMVLTRVALFSGTQQPSTQRFLHGERSVVEDRQNQVLPLLPLIIGGLGLSLFALRRQPWLALGLLFMILPFGLSLRYQAMTRVLPRFLMAPLVPMPILMGVGFVYLTTRFKGELAPWRGWASALVVLGCLTALVLGLFPSHLSPKAPWRVEIETINSALLQTRQLSNAWSQPNRDPRDAVHACEPVMRVDYAMDRDPWGQLHPQGACLADTTDEFSPGELWTVEWFFKRLPAPESLKEAR